MTDQEKQELARQIHGVLSGEASQGGYRGPLTAPANPGENATLGQRALFERQTEAYTEALMQRDANTWTAEERAHMAGQIARALGNL